MSENSASRRAKQHVLALVEQRVGPTRPGAKRRRDWRVSADGATSVFVTFSREYSSGSFFYDVSADDLRRWLETDRAYVVFVAGTAEEAFVVPVRELASRLLQHRPTTDGGNYKLHLEVAPSGARFREVPDLSIACYRNGWSVLAEDPNAPEVAVVREFSVLVEQDAEGYYVASVPALPGCHTQARSLDLLMERIREAIELYLEVQQALPAPLHFVGVQRVLLAA